MPALLVVGGIAVRGGRLLLARRPVQGAHPGLWELPGGKVEEGETPEEALVREWREELGVRIGGLVPHGFATGDSAGRPLTLLFFTIRCLEGEPAAVGCDGVRWSDAAEALLLAVPPADAPTLRRLAEDGDGDFRDTVAPDCDELRRSDPRIATDADLRSRGAITFSRRLGERSVEGILLATPGGATAFENRCPHVPIPLDRTGEPLLTGDGRLACRQHGAIFEPESGRCVDGPCRGDALRPIAIQRRHGDWVLLP